MNETNKNKENTNITKQSNNEPKKVERLRFDDKFVNEKIKEISDKIPGILNEAFKKIQNKNKNIKDTINKDKLNEQSPEVILEYFNVLSIRQFSSSDYSLCVLVGILALLIFSRILDLYYVVDIYTIIGFSLYVILAVVRRLMWK